jgi:hypothetical protein
VTAVYFVARFLFFTLIFGGRLLLPMTNAVAAYRSLIVYALILPLALVMGYLLATPLDPATLVLVTLVLVLLAAPLVLRWHHPLVFLTWNMTAVLFMLPGRPQIWMLAAVVSLGMSIVQRTLSSEMRFLSVGSVLGPVLFLTTVVVITAMATGGFGMQILGGDVYGGRRYVTAFAGVCGFLAMIAQRIPTTKAKLYTGLFFLGMVSDALGSSLRYVNPAFYFIYWVFPVELTDLSVNPSVMGEGISRFYGLGLACQGVFYFLLARFGIQGMLGVRTSWRFLVLCASLVVCTLGGFRSFFVLMVLTFACVFYFEGLLRSKYAGIFAILLVLGGATLFPFVQKLPMSVQRSLSVIPFVEIDPVARYDTQFSNEWRFQMWKAVLPEVPKYFWFGKGLGINAQDLYVTSELARHGRISSWEVAMIAGDYHSGPLSVIIPFGVWGAIGFLWFLIASIRALHHNRLYGDESLKTINTFLLAYFVARTVLFFVVFGGFYADFGLFCGIIGLSLAINGGIRKPATAPVRVQQPSETGFPARLSPSAGLSG